MSDKPLMRYAVTYKLLGCGASYGSWASEVVESPTMPAPGGWFLSDVKAVPYGSSVLLVASWQGWL